MKINSWNIEWKFYTFLSLFVILTAAPAYAQKEDVETEDNGCVTEKQISKSARKTFDKAKKLYQKGSSSEAMTLFKEVVEEEPTFAEPFFIMGKINLKQLEKLDSQLPGKGRDVSESQKNQLLKKAENNFSSAIKACKDVDISCYFFLGKLLYIQDRFKEAGSPLDYFIKNADSDKFKDNIEIAKEDLEYCKFLDKVLNNKVPFNLKKVEGVSSPNNEYLFCVSPDDEICFYTRVLTPEKSQGEMSYTPKPKEYFYYSIRDSNARFDHGNPMIAPFNLGGNEGSPTITVDNKYMVFAKVVNVDGYENSDLYFSEFKDDDWTPVTNLGFGVNSPRTWESQPSISADGKTLYFVTDRDDVRDDDPEHEIDLNIYVSYRQPDGGWGKAQSVGNTINTLRQEKTPFIHSDSQTLYFSSDGHTGVGGMDIYFSKKDDNGRWVKPKNIGVPINTESDDVGFFVSTDGTKGYYTSAKSGNFDLYEFDLYVEARPQRVVLIKGEVKSEEGEPIPARIELKNTETKNVIEIPVDHTTGKYAMVALLKNDYVLTVKKEGYAYETKFIDSKDTMAPTKHNIDFAISVIEEGKSYKLNDIYFATNSFEMTRENKLVTDAFIEFLTENPTVEVEIQGHTDNIGNDADNMSLSSNRAKSVYDYILSMGVSANRLKYKGYGKTKPVDSNDTEEGRSKNRRTVFVILKR